MKTNRKERRERKENQPPPLFEEYADRTLAVVRRTYAARGASYGDSWRDAPWLKLRAVARELGLRIPDDCLRALALAALCDVKYNRNRGGWKADSLIDEMAYDAVLVEEMSFRTAKGKR